MNVNILDFGARTELADNSFAIQKAIDVCAENGGGRVTVPTGRFVTGTIRLKSNIEFHLEMGAVLSASTDADTYNKLEEYPENFQCAAEGWDFRHLILGIGVDNVAITGFGTIEGAADFFYGERVWIGYFYWRDGGCWTKGQENGNTRPGQLIVFVNASNINITDIKITKSTSWSCFFHGCEYVQVRGVKIFNSKYHVNTDGLDIDSSKYVTVSDCIIKTGDDCIAVRGAAQRLNNKSTTCENIVITNCVLSCSADAFRIGVGVGAIKHLRVSNIVVENSGALIGFNTSYMGVGHCEMDDINFSNISAQNTSNAFEINACSVKVSRVTFENIRADVMSRSLITADEKGILSDVTLRNIDMYYRHIHTKLDEAVRAERGEYMLDIGNVDNLITEGIRIFAPDDVLALWSGKERIVNCD